MSTRKKLSVMLAAIAKKYPKRTGYGFFHTPKESLSTKINRIVIYAILFNPDKGHSLFVWNLKRAQLRTPKEWATWIEEKGEKILSVDVMDAIYSSHGTEYTVKQILGFRDAVHKSYNVDTHKKRNRSTKKRKQNRVHKSRR